MPGSSRHSSPYNGIEKAPHVRHQMAELITLAELVYGTGIAASVKGTEAPSGTYVPDIVFINVARYHAGINVYREHEILAEITGGLPATLPPEKDFYSPAIADFLAKYIMRREGVSVEDQHRAFRFFSDLLASAHAGMSTVAGIHGGGSPIMEKLRSRGNTI